MVSIPLRPGAVGSLSESDPGKRIPAGPCRCWPARTTCRRRRSACGFNGAGKRGVRVGYVVERPIWKTTYRLVLEPNGKLFLQGWAIVENTSDDDWNRRPHGAGLGQADLLPHEPVRAAVHPAAAGRAGAVRVAAAAGLWRRSIDLASAAASRWRRQAPAPGGGNLAGGPRWLGGAIPATPARVARWSSRSTADRLGQSGSAARLADGQGSTAILGNQSNQNTACSNRSATCVTSNNQQQAHLRANCSSATGMQRAVKE